MNHNKEIKVTDFIHHNQPYGTDHINGVWVPYTVEDYNQAIIDNTRCNNVKYHPCSHLSFDYANMIKARLQGEGGLLFGIITKGSTTNRIFQHKATTDNTGNKVHGLFMRLRDIEKGEKVSVAM